MTDPTDPTKPTRDEVLAALDVLNRAVIADDRRSMGLGNRDVEDWLRKICRNSSLDMYRLTDEQRSSMEQPIGLRFLWALGHLVGVDMTRAGRVGRGGT